MVLSLRKLLKTRTCRASGFVKDRFAIAAARLSADPRTAAMQVCVIRATTHSQQPPSKEVLDAALRALSGSRVRVLPCIKLLMTRLRKAKSWVVALKCLTLVHKALHHGGFIYQEQLLSLYPKGGGTNAFNFSQFRDRSSVLSWTASSWVRWYAAYLEALIKASSILSTGKAISSLQNDTLMERCLLLGALVREMSDCPLEHDMAGRHTLIAEAFHLAVKDCITLQHELRGHLQGLCIRLGDLTVLQITKLLGVQEALNRDCKGLTSFIEVAISRNYLGPKIGFDQLILTGNELVRMKQELLQRLHASMAAVDPSTRSHLRKDVH